MTPAERLLLGLGIAELKDIDLDAIAWTQGVVVNYKPIDKLRGHDRGIETTRRDLDQLPQHASASTVPARTRTWTLAPPPRTGSLLR